jgi:hypothetical protein
MFGMSEMADVRKTDQEPRMWFRTSRFFQQEGKWFFYTREGTMEGPFTSMEAAEDRLEGYIRIMSSGFMPRNSKLKVESADPGRLRAEAAKDPWGR